MRAAVLGDVGQPVYHVGDEAMAHAAIDELRRRGVDDIVVLTRNVQESAAAFDAEAVPTLPFPWPPHERSDYLRRVLAAAEGDHSALPDSDPAQAFIAALGGCDALLVAGGGNLNSLYGWLLYERVAAVRIAKLLGLRVVVSGQTLGPDLHGPDEEAALSLLQAADLVGAREVTTLGLMRRLAGGDAPTRLCLDDASFMSGAEGGASHTGIGAPDREDLLPAEPYLAVTFSPGHGEVDRETYVGALSAALDDAVRVTGCPVVFVPHMATPPSHGTDAGEGEADADQQLMGRGDVDEHLHHDVAARMKSERVVLLPIQDARRTAMITERAAMVITSRYHPVVFALQAGVPVVALVPENYSDVRIRGALHNWGVANLALPLPCLIDGTLTQAIEDIWTRRAALTDYLADARRARQEWHHSWWDDVVSVLGGAPAPEELQLPEAGTPPPFAEEWQARSEAAGSVFLRTTAAVSGLRVENQHLHGQQELLLRQRDEAREELAAWMGSRSFSAVRKVAAAAAWLRGSR